MTFFQSIVVAVTEGLTEFLPISSTAHMKFVQALMGIGANPFDDMFEIVIQLGAILAVVVLYYKKFFDGKLVRFYGKLLVALIPAVLAGVFLGKYVKAVIDDLRFISWVMIVGGIVLLFVDNFFRYRFIDTEKGVSFKKAFVIGCGQVLSFVFPGLSRSAATIVTGLSQGLTRSTAAEFSFFLAVPTMFAASAKSFWDTYKSNPEVLHSGNFLQLAVGCLIAFLVAMVAIRFFLDFLKKHGFRVWGVYRIIAGVVMLLLLWKGVVK